MDKRYSYESIWGVASSVSVPTGNGLSCLELDSHVEAGAVLAASDASGHYLLLVPLLAAELTPPNHPSAILTVKELKLSGTRYIAVSCGDQNLNDVFIIFAREVVESLPEMGPTCNLILEMLARWRDLFARLRDTGALTVNQLAGLYGELTVLERILWKDPKRDLDVWVGASKARQDFRVFGHALEVKTSLAREGSRIRIHGVLQLEAPDDCSLHLIHLRVQLEPEGDTLPELVTRVRSLGVDRASLDKKLLEYGYRSAHSEAYMSHRFRILEESTFDVRDRLFPKIVPHSFVQNQLPQGVESLSYVCDLAVVGHSRLNSEQANRVISNMAGMTNA